MRAILLVSGFICLSLCGVSQQVQRSLTAANGTHIGFYEFRPYNYNSNPTRKYPVIIFLQGVGGQGNGTSELSLELAAGLPRYISEGATMTFTVNGTEESFIVLSPQLDQKYGSWQNFYVDEMLNYARQNLRVDNDRIYLTGLSLGGGGTWKYASTSKANAQQFAAIAPICGTCDYNYSSLGGSIAAGLTAVWAYHATDDPVVAVSCTNTAIDGLRAASPAKEVKKTIYSSGQHGIWDRAYGPTNTSDVDGTPRNLFEWMLTKSRAGSVQPNMAPVPNAGSDISITLPASTITLNGSASSDPDGTITAFSWSKLSGPAATISNSTAASTGVSGLSQGSYVFRLTATDNSGATAFDDVTVNVNAAQGGTGSGLRFRYYEGDWNVLPNFDALTPVKTGSTANVDMSARNRGDSYGFVWEGSINITTPGNYTFETVSDDGSKFYFNSSYSPGVVALVNNDGLHAAASATGTVNIPTAGVYPVAATFFEKGSGETMQVYWSGPGFSRQLIPNSAFSGGGTQTAVSGLKYRYYEGDWNVLPNFAALTPVKSGSSANVDMSTRNRYDYYGFLWEGYINISTPGNYTFETVSDDGSRLYFNTSYSAGAAPLVNNDGLHPAQSAFGSVNVPTAGFYPIAISFFEKGAGETMQVYWSGPGFSRQLIPSSVFSEGASQPTATGGLNYRYYEGDWNVLPNFSGLTPVKTGSTSNVDMSPKNTNDFYGFIWEGYINISTPGNYTFETVSDDGSKMYFNSLYSPTATALVNNDGLHAARSATGTINVAAAGYYPVAFAFFEKGGGEIMQVYWSGPGFARQLIPNSAFLQSSPTGSAQLSEVSVISATPDPQTTGASSVLANSEKAREDIFNAFPNPFRESFTIEFYNKTVSDVSIGLYDQSGKMVHNYTFRNVSANHNRLKIDLARQAKLVPGIYYARLSANGIPSRVIKLVKEK